MSDIDVQCEDCRSAARCESAAAMHRVSVIAWAHGRPAPSCPFFSRRWFRGIEGVVDIPRAPVSASGAQR